MKFTQQIAIACGELEDTLGFYGQRRRVLEAEKLALGRAIQQHGLEPVILCLTGARHEPKAEKFDPADWVNLDRYLLAKNFKRFVGLGARAIGSEKRQVNKLRPDVDWGPLGPPDEDAG